MHNKVRQLSFLLLINIVFSMLLASCENLSLEPSPSVINHKSQQAGEKYEQVLADKESLISLDFGNEGVAVNPGIYSAGYDGWGDITDPASLNALKQVNLSYLRIVVNLELAAGDFLEDEVDIGRLIENKDKGLNLKERIIHARENGFIPILAFSTNHRLPKYFYPKENKINSWFQYNLDGDKARNHIGNQIDEYARIAGHIARQLKNEGLTGLIWESIYEIGYGYSPFGMAPLAIHYETAKAIKEVDSTSLHMGPATWTGWAVEKFVDDYFTLYGKEGAEYLDYVSFHQYGGNTAQKYSEWWDYKKQLISMVKSDEHIQNGMPIKNLSLLKLLSALPSKASDSTQALKKLLAEKKQNLGFSKNIGVAISEYDVNNYSNYKKNPSNEDYPSYNPASDTNINTNYFGGVNTAYLLASCAVEDVDIMIKFNTRQYYGIVDQDYDRDGAYYRTPLWFSFKLLQEKLGLKEGSSIFPAEIRGSLDEYEDIAKPLVFAAGIKQLDKEKNNILIINTDDKPHAVKLTLSGLGSDVRYEIYEYSKATTAQFIGNIRLTGHEEDGIFEGGLEDGWEYYLNGGAKEKAANTCLFAKNEIDYIGQVIELVLDGFSYLVLEMQN